MSLAQLAFSIWVLLHNVCVHWRIFVDFSFDLNCLVDLLLLVLPPLARLLGRYERSGFDREPFLEEGCFINGSPVYLTLL